MRAGPVHDAGSDGGLRHPELLRGLLILSDDGSPHSLDKPHAQLAISAPTREYYGNNPRFEMLRCGYETFLRRRAGEVKSLRLVQGEDAAVSYR